MRRGRIHHASTGAAESKHAKTKQPRSAHSSAHSSASVSSNHTAPPTPRGLSSGATPTSSQLLSSNASKSLACTSYDRLHHSRYGQQLVEHLGAAAGVRGHIEGGSSSSGASPSGAASGAAASAGGAGGAEGVPRNPFRPPRRREMAVMNASAPLNALDPLAYRPSARVLACGGLTAVVRPDRTLGGAVPTQDEVGAVCLCVCVFMCVLCVYVCAPCLCTHGLTPLPTTYF